MPLIAFQILIQIVLILINAFFAATEIAVISLSANKLRKLEEEGDKLALKLLRMVEGACRISSPPSKSALLWLAFLALLLPLTASRSTSSTGSVWISASPHFPARPWIPSLCDPDHPDPLFTSP